MGGPQPHRGTDTTRRQFGAGRTFPTALEQVPEADGGGAQQLVPQRVAAPHLQVQVALRRDVPGGGHHNRGHGCGLTPLSEGQRPAHKPGSRRGRQQLPHPEGWPSHSSRARGCPSSQELWGSPQRPYWGAGGPPAPQRGLAGTYRTRISFQSSSELPICFPVFLVSLGSPSPATST